MGNAHHRVTQGWAKSTSTASATAANSLLSSNHHVLLIYILRRLLNPTVIKYDLPHSSSSLYPIPTIAISHLLWPPTVHTMDEFSWGHWPQWPAPLVQSYWSPTLPTLPFVKQPVSFLQQIMILPNFSLSYTECPSHTHPLETHTRNYQLLKSFFGCGLYSPSPLLNYSSPDGKQCH